MACSAFGCTKRHSKKESDVHFFRFPLGDNGRLKQWVRNVRRKNWTPSKSSRLCSTHFEEDQFRTDKTDKRRLKDTAVPTIFNFPPHLWKVKKETIRSTRTKSVESRDSSVSTSVHSRSSPSCLARPHGAPGPVAHLCSALDNEAVTNIDNGDGGSIPSAHHNAAIVKQEPAEETDVVDGVLHGDIVMTVVHADVDEAVADDATECTTSGDSQTVMHDHSYLCTRQQQVFVCADHSYISESLRTLQRKSDALQDQLVVARKKIRLKCQQTRRMKSRLLSLKKLTKVLQKKLANVNQGFPHALQDQLVVARKKLSLKCRQTRRMKSRLLSLKDLTKVLKKKLKKCQCSTSGTPIDRSAD